jgi:hypothetical protein
MADVGGITGADGAASGSGWEIEERDGKDGSARWNLSLKRSKLFSM